MSDVDEIPVSGEDDLSLDTPEHPPSHVRKVGEFKPSNVPLSAAEVEHRLKAPGVRSGDDWAARSDENIQQVNPLEDADEDFAAQDHRTP